MKSTFPEESRLLGGPCTKQILQKMLANRRYGLIETRYKKDNGRVLVYMFDRWANPAMVKIGEYLDGAQAEWAAMYDAAMRCHLDRKRSRSRYGVWD